MQILFKKTSAKHSAILNTKIASRERCKGVHCVDLGESFPTSIYLQKSASIQPRTSPSKFGEKFNSLFTSLLTPDGDSDGRWRRCVEKRKNRNYRISDLGSPAHDGKREAAAATAEASAAGPCVTLRTPKSPRSAYVSFLSGSSS